MHKGQLYIFSGPSGSGKDTILNVVLKKVDSLQLSISSVTRAMRDGEVNGEKYNFISRSDFEKLISEDALLEYNVFLGQYYGTPRGPVEEYLNRGIDVILEIDVNGAQNVKAKCPDAISIFVMPPSFETLKTRLNSRGTETVDLIEKRLKVAMNEISMADCYDYIVVNDVLEQACLELESIIISNRCKTKNRNSLLKEFSKC